MEVDGFSLFDGNPDVELEAEFTGSGNSVLTETVSAAGVAGERMMFGKVGNNASGIVSEIELISEEALAT